MPGILTAESLPRIQGNIVTPFRKRRFLYLFARFADRRTAGTWLETIVADSALASAQRMLDEPERPAWLGIGFTIRGLEILSPGLAQQLAVYPAFAQGAAACRDYGDDGPRTSAALVGDATASAPSEWVVGAPGQSDVDVVLTIAADDGALTAVAEREWSRADAHGLDVLLLDQGGAEGTTRGQFAGPLPGGTDHFGFRDGISQPGVRGFTPEVIRHRRLEVADQPGSPIIAPGEFVLGYDAEPRFYPVADDKGRPEPPAWMFDGSFQVLLRLTQDVPGWRSQATHLRSEVAATADVAESAIGRTTAGRPFAPVEGGGFGGDNDFTFDKDPGGATTPLYAHIRKMNPRDDDVFHDRQHRLLRRGTSFGPELSAGGGDDRVARGMMFNAFMASIEDQFEYVQRHWAHSFTGLSSPAPAGGPDALVGASDDARPLQRNGRTFAVSFAPFVRTTGAVYAFAPSIPALRGLVSSATT